MRKLADFFTDKKIIVSLVLLGAFFFYPFFIFGKIPIPSDALVGLYYPFRDVLVSQYPNGYPYKNPLITDPVRQQYVWRELVVESLKKGELPLWNPYSFSGTPLVANFQSAAFYPLNVLFFIFSFPVAWGVLVSLQPILSLVFMYLYLRELKVTKAAAIVGSLAFSFSGFSISWLTWNTVGHTLLWLPLILLSYEKLIVKMRIRWICVLVISLCSSFFAGHLQTFFYIVIFSGFYLVLKILSRLHHFGKKKYFTGFMKAIPPFVLLFFLVGIVTSLNWIPGFKFISLSSRAIDQGSWQKDGWFLPVQNLFQFFAPDFFGNPATGNYYGVWNYGEFIGYIGLVPLFFAMYAGLKLRDRKSIFFLSVIVASIILATDNFISQVPYRLNIPFISTSQPTRLLSLIDFSLAVLSALGVDQLRRNVKQKISVLFSLGIVFFLLGVWIFTHNSVARNNLYLSIVLGVVVLFATQAYRIKPSKILLPVFLFATVFDLFRFGWKFTPFTSQDFLYPESSILAYLKSNGENYRVMTTDRRILPPNVSVHYKLQDVAGYDPLYLLSYNVFVSVWNSNKGGTGASAFNRIVTPQNYNGYFTDLLGVKYLMSLAPIDSEKWEYVTKEGETYLYQNKDVKPRTYLASSVVTLPSDEDVLNSLIGRTETDKVYSTEDIPLKGSSLTSDEFATIQTYGENSIVLRVKASDTRMLVLTDPYYPSWKAYVDGKESKIYKVNFLFRGVIVGSGTHRVEFKNYLF